MCNFTIMSTQISGKKLLAEMSNLMRHLHTQFIPSGPIATWVSRPVRFREPLPVPSILQRAAKGDAPDVAPLEKLFCQ